MSKSLTNLEIESIRSELSQQAKSFLSKQEGKLITSLVIAPLLLTLIYLYLFMPDRYISQATLSVYDANNVAVPSDLISSLGISSGQDQNDSRLIEAFLQSPHMIEKLDQELGFKEHFSEGFDFLFGLSSNASKEEVEEFYLQRVSVSIDAPSGLLVLKTEAYSPEMALAFNEFLIKEGEFFINEVNNRVARSEMQFAQDEIARSLKILREAQIALTDFQDSKDLASPELEGQSIITIIYTLETALAETKALLGETLTYLSPESAQAKTLAAKVKSFEEQISEQKTRITGTEKGFEGISRLGVDYGDLQYDVELAKIVYESAVSSFELARGQASKKLKHLLIARSPVLAEESLLPKRGYWLVTLSLLYLAIYGIVRMIISSIREHRE